MEFVGKSGLVTGNPIKPAREEMGSALKSGSFREQSCDFHRGTGHFHVIDEQPGLVVTQAFAEHRPSSFSRQKRTSNRRRGTMRGPSSGMARSRRIARF